MRRTTWGVARKRERPPTKSRKRRRRRRRRRRRCRSEARRGAADRGWMDKAAGGAGAEWRWQKRVGGRGLGARTRDRENRSRATVACVFEGAREGLGLCRSALSDHFGVLLGVIYFRFSTICHPIGCATFPNMLWYSDTSFQDCLTTCSIRRMGYLQ